MPLLSVESLHSGYASGHGILRAVDGVSFHIDKGETLGLVGESGCGKSTLGKALLRLVPSSQGTIRLDGTDITRLSRRALRPHRRRMQMVFQDPFGSLNPRQTVHSLLDTALKVHGLGDRDERRRLAAEIVQRVGLPASSLTRFPHEFSGGQRQRIGIARALVLQPELIVCDEPVSALDVSIQAQILNLLVDLKCDLGLSYLFISHDLSVVRYFADRVLVMYLGRIVESADHASLWRAPRHPYTRALIEAVPSTAPERRRIAGAIAGDLPSAVQVPAGCRFRSRCPLADERCAHQEPALRQVAAGHAVACHFAEPAPFQNIEPQPRKTL
ncbi:ABC transporter ATP-binding protein [Telmatospirillum siberiense]|uniref:Peptide ABC transporter ATP-binding protein n=1 Tax=Telmatospirillum siberiense TaxID=382514 RepID=A0A2N3PP00_9PROT|nr:oligopeptide/dipeptide ABC transporter ATP-binding protein [Telmatospirillum siberiense]PKU22118.1 peptide ABC transporter ATP-binding protein [Telmatospirillum siberiense]